MQYKRKWYDTKDMLFIEINFASSVSFAQKVHTQIRHMAHIHEGNSHDYETYDILSTDLDFI